MNENIVNIDGDQFIHDDWYPGSLPKNIILEPYAYPGSSYSFSGFYSEEEEGFVMGYASGSYAFGNFFIGKQGKVTIGKYVILNAPNIICNSSISIGDHCMFGWGCTISDSWLTSATGPVERKNFLLTVPNSKNRHFNLEDYAKPIVIEDNVWVGFDAVILPGVRLGRGCVIGCKTVITEDVPPYVVVVGSPPRIVKHLHPDDSKEKKMQALNEYTSIK